MLRNNVVCGDPVLNIPAHLSLGQYVLDRLRQNCKQRNGIALINGETGQSTTYKELLQDTINFASGLKTLGVRPGDVVAILSENINEYFTAVFGSICCGGIVTTLNNKNTKDELLHAVHLSKPTVIICSEAAMERNLDTIKSIPYIKTIIQFDGKPVESSILSYERVMVYTDALAYEPVQIKGCCSTVFIMNSSGTTGMPKGVMLTHSNLLYIMANLDYGYTAEECSRSLVVVPWYHALGLVYVMSHLLGNKLTVFSQGFNTEKYLTYIQDYKIDILITAPPIVIKLSKSPLVEKYDTSSVKVIWCGGAPLGSKTTVEVLKRMPNCVYINQLYGMTETTFGVVKDLDSIKSNPKPGSCGYPIAGYKVKVVNIETREKLGPNNQGEICLKGPSLMKGYIRDETSTRDIMDEEGYIKTGDIGYYDEDGCLFVIDRLKELIKYKAFQVSPVVVEKVLLQHDAIAECGVVGRPDEYAGELPTAFVVLKAGFNVTEEELLRFASDRLSTSTMLHGGIIFINEIPKTRSGKIIRSDLRNRLQK